jgi:hypothetical protein
MGITRFILKACISVSEEITAKVRHRCSLAAHAIQSLDPKLLEDAFKQVVTKKEEGTGLTDHQWLLLLGTLGDLRSIWALIPSSSEPRIRQLLSNAPIGEMIKSGVFGIALQDPYEELISSRLDEDHDPNTLRNLVSLTRRRELVPQVLAVFAESDSFVEAEWKMSNLVLPIADSLARDDVRQILGAFRANEQIQLARRMPRLMENFFRITGSLSQSMKNDWKQFSDFVMELDETGGFYSYPGVRALISAIDE